MALLNLFLQGVIDEHRNINESLHQMSELSSAWSLTESEVTSTVISGSQYDSHLPSKLNLGWSRAVQDVIVKTDSKHVVISEGDRNNLLGDLVSQVLAPVVRIVKTWRQQHL